MRTTTWLSLVATTLLAACNTPVSNPPQSMKSIEHFQKRAARFNAALTLPPLETTPGQITNSINKAIAEANGALDSVARTAAAKVTLGNTVRALDDIVYQAGLTANRAALLKETSTSAAVRDAATAMTKVFQDWAVGMDYREDVYRVVKAFADTKPPLTGEDAKLLEETMRDYRRAGMHLPRSERDEVERLRKELARLSTDFDSNVTKARKPMKFTRADLEGVPESFFSAPGVKTGDDEYTVMANITWHFVTVMENAKKESTRKRLKVERYNLAKEENVPLLQKILELRAAIANKLGYKSWADYQIEPKMAKNARTAHDFLLTLKDGLHPKFDAEITEFKKLKARDTGEADSNVEIWDWRYYSNQLKKERYTVDAEQLRVFFPCEKVLEGMFGTYERIFSLKIERIEPPYKWVDDLQLHVVSDSRTGEPLGAFYLDMFPRDGKFNHFAQFGIVDGKLLPNGKYQRPTVALICNFPAPARDKPSLLSHSEVETLFHEFGHALHSILTRAKYARFSGTSVPRDFVEAPSQMLENWVWDKTVLDTFAADYRDPSKKIPQAILNKLEEARLATIGTFYRRQLSMGLLDLALHEEPKEGQNADSVKVSNDIIGGVFFPVPGDTAFVAYFGHLTGYDAGYYGYAWADAIAADLATVFENAPNKYLDVEAGMRLRREVYEPGHSRDVNESILKFLGRERSIEPFLKTIGIKAKVRQPGSKLFAD